MNAIHPKGVVDSRAHQEPHALGVAVSTQARKPRYEQIDIYRAIAVIGVVFSHAVIGLNGEGLLEPGVGIHAFNSWVYAFRMPAIALVLGLFISYGVEKYGTGRYIARRAVFAAWLYMVWYAIQVLFEIATSNIKNHPVTLAQVLTIWEPKAQLWFIPFIAVSAFIIALARPWTRIGWVTLPLLVIGSTALWGWSPGFVGLDGLALIGFSAVGATIGVVRLGNWMRTFTWPAIGVGILALIAALTFYGQMIVPSSVSATPEQWELGREAWLPQSVAMAWLGQFILAGLAALLWLVPGVRGALAYIGRQTLPVFLAHIIIIAGLRIALVQIGVTSVPLLLTAMMVVGVGLPLVIERLSRTNILNYLWHPPAKLIP